MTAHGLSRRIRGKGIVAGYHKSASPCRAANRAPISDLRHHAPKSLLFAPLRLYAPVAQSEGQVVRFELKAPRTFSTIILLGTINRDARLARYTAQQKSMPPLRV